MNNYIVITNIINKQYPYRTFKSWLNLSNTKLLINTLSNKLNVVNLYYEKNNKYNVHEELVSHFKEWVNRPKKEDTSAVIYVYEDVNKYKVGYSTNFEQRHKKHMTSNPFLKLVKVVLVIHKSIELIIHNRLIKYRLKSTKEWYVKSYDVLSIIDSILIKYNNVIDEI